jgi:1-acyl-sn-glycerol-3-phosphate acyltransferase
MRYVAAPFVLLYKLWFGLMFFGQLILLWPVFKILMSREKWFPTCFIVMRAWARFLKFSMGVFVKKTKNVPLPKPPYIICANHSSYLDIVLMYCVMPKYFLFLGKHELRKWPLMRIFFLRMNITVNREKRIEAVRSLIRAGNELDAGTNIAIFPEGTMPEGAPKMIPFKNGAFQLAIKKQVPIVPVTFVNNWKLFSDHTKAFTGGRPGFSHVQIHEAIETKGMTDQDLVALSDRIFKIIQQPLLDDEN